MKEKGSHSRDDPGVEIDGDHKATATTRLPRSRPTLLN